MWELLIVLFEEQDVEVVNMKESVGEILSEYGDTMPVSRFQIQ
jgi:hypothetical protein